MKKIMENKPNQICSDCIHYSACAAWNIGSIVNMDGTRCANFERIDVSAVPVVRGKWIAEQKNAEYCEFRCSSCDHSIGETDQFDENEVMQFSEWYRYCPNCGAKMEEEK